MTQPVAARLQAHYIYNSGFAVTYGDRAFVIDYYRGWGGQPGDGGLPLPGGGAAYSSVAVLASHVHPDHYSKQIFSWQAGRPDIAYVLSSDIEPRARRDAVGVSAGSVTFVGPGDEAVVSGSRVRAFGSTDAGVSFLVDVPNGPMPNAAAARFFHAGDLNYWHWMEHWTPGEVAHAKSAFMYELSMIEGVCEPGTIDAAFFPVDPRLGTDYYRGAVLFCERFRPRSLVPMHFGDRFSAPDAFFSEASRFSNVARVCGPGEVELI